MKQLTIITNTLAAIILLSGCSQSTTVAPSQNSALNSISKSNASKERKGVMQNSLDNWFKTEWEPSISKDKVVQEKYMEAVEEENLETNASSKKSVINYRDKKGRPFTLQEYVDKASAYIKSQPNDYEHSNVKKLESLPAIGK